VVRVLPMGERAVLVADLACDPAAWSVGLRSLALDGVVDVVPAAETVLVACASSAALAHVRARLGGVVPAVLQPGSALVDIVVRYDGPDLADVAAATGLDVDTVIAAHIEPIYEVAFCGFAPGFGYLRGLDPRLHLPRRATPRVSVPAGSVAIAADYTAVYPRPSPGGWHLLGTTEAVLFDSGREQPALLAPGTFVRFVPT
jgi:KipI family sensor histidine kinase inhibitor